MMPFTIEGFLTVDGMLVSIVLAWPIFLIYRVGDKVGSYSELAEDSGLKPLKPLLSIGKDVFFDTSLLIRSF
mgnify:CR=1 FL=1